LFLFLSREETMVSQSCSVVYGIDVSDGTKIADTGKFDNILGPFLPNTTHCVHTASCTLLSSVYVGYTTPAVCLHESKRENFDSLHGSPGANIRCSFRSFGRPDRTVSRIKWRPFDPFLLQPARGRIPLWIWSGEYPGLPWG